jgi:mRNA-degrading endonuclease toxin of MazEF toxin-antitoxin module
MRRGDIWTVAGGKDYAGKPRAVAIVRDDSFDATDWITVCAFTTYKTEAAPSQRTRRKPRYSACLWNRMSATACGRHAA